MWKEIEQLEADLSFAQKWGPLGLERREEERLDSWREHARLALVLLRFAGQRATGGRGDEEDWRVICKSTPARSIDRKGMPIERRFYSLADRSGKSDRLKPALILFSESLSVRFAVRVEEILAALLPRRFEFGRCDVPVWPAFPGNGT